MALLALGLLLPLQSYFIAQSNIFTRLELTDTRLALIIPYTAMGLPLAVYLLKVYLDALPEELFDAARVDGAGDLRMFWTIALPLLRPGLATVAIFSALAAWNEFLLALLYIQDDALKTIPTGLLAFSSRYRTDYGLLFSALSIVTIPDDRHLRRLQPPDHRGHHCRQPQVSASCHGRTTMSLGSLLVELVVHVVLRLNAPSPLASIPEEALVRGPLKGSDKVAQSTGTDQTRYVRSRADDLRRTIRQARTKGG